MTESLANKSYQPIAPRTNCPFGGNFPQAREAEHPLNPAPGYADFREQGPIVEVELYDGTKSWLITRHDEVIDVLSDRRFSAIPNEGYPMISPGAAAAKRIERTFLRMDPPKHTDHRRMW